VAAIEMTEGSPRYRRIRGKKKCLGIGYYTLWEAEDHLLQVYSRFGVEDYKRFYFADIQAVVACKTSKGTVTSLALAVLAILFTLAAGSWGWALVAFGIPAGVLALCAIVNVLRGPTCITTITTAVQTESLHSLYRLRSTLDFMSRLRLLTHRFQKPQVTGASRARRDPTIALRTAPATVKPRPPRAGPADSPGGPTTPAGRRPAAGALSRPERGDKR
jgi:hypothetical protein